MGIEIGLFGGVRAASDGVPVALRGDLPLAILGRLALTPGEYVATDRLIADLWVDPPERAVSSLRASLSRMRALGLGAALLGLRQGYLLDLPPAAVDVARFRAGLAADAPDDLTALVRLEQVSAARLFGALEGAPYLDAARQVLAEERRQLVERLAELRIERGEPALATILLADAVAAHPLAERPVRLLATALARSGRTTDALETLAALGARLEAAGIAPSPRLAELGQSILRQDPVVLGGAAVAPRRTGIPIPLTRFVGRAALRARLRALRAGGSAGAEAPRLLTLVGPAGVGKTRLAIEHAREATTATDVEQWLVDLAVLDAADAVLPAIADVLGAHDSTVDAVARRVGAHPALLVLDNADHLLGAVAAILPPLLDGAPRLRVLVTSREALRLPGEEVVVVDPLLGDDLADAAAILEQRAADARGGVDLDPAERELVPALAAELDGVPLALELAAARLDLAAVGDLLGAVGGPAPTGPVPDARPGAGARRHSTVDDAVRWSIALLDPAQRELLAQLARFAGRVPLEAIAGVCDLGDHDIPALVDSLVEKSLVAVARGDSGKRSYRLLVSVRAVARTLPVQDADTAWQARHRAWFAGLVTRQAPLLRTFDVRAAGIALELVAADLRFALDDAVRAADREHALQLVAGLAWHWFLRGQIREGRASVERALAVPGTARDATEAAAALGACNLAYQSGDAAAAFALIARARAHAVAAGDRAIELVALAQEGYGRSLFGDLPTAERLMAEAAALEADAPDWARAEYGMSLGQMRRAGGDLRGALDALTEAHRVAATVGYRWMVASATYVTGKVLLQLRRPREAIALVRSGAERMLASEDPADALALLHVAAGACAFVERHEEGARLFGAIDALGARYGYDPVATEGADAQALRDAVAAGLPPGEYGRAHRSGARLGFAEALRLVGSLPRPVPRTVGVDGRAEGVGA